MTVLSLFLNISCSPFSISPQTSKSKHYLVCEHIVSDSISWLVCYVIVMCGATALVSTHTILLSIIDLRVKFLSGWGNKPTSIDTC